MKAEDCHIAVELKGLCTGYRQGGKDRVVSSGLCARLHAGSMACLIGPNGAGKSTLLKTMAAFMPPLSGEVLMGNSSVGKMDARQLAKTVSVVLTDSGMIKSLTVYDVVAMGRHPYTGFWGRLGGKDREIVDECIDLVGMGGLKDQLFETLSDGERQKTMIAKALAQQTPVILLDEPTAFLYYPNKVMIMLLLRTLARELGKTVLLSTHDIDLALQIADRLWLLDKEKGLTTGERSSLCANGVLEEYVHSEYVAFDRKTGTFRVNDVRGMTP